LITLFFAIQVCRNYIWGGGGVVQILYGYDIEGGGVQILYGY
jgi:hypothetical protein